MSFALLPVLMGWLCVMNSVFTITSIKLVIPLQRIHKITRRQLPRQQPTTDNSQTVEHALADEQELDEEE